MAKRTVIVDDLTGDEGARTVTFGLGSQRWTIDLTEETFDQLRDALEPYIAKAQPIRSGATQSSTPRKSGRTDIPLVREWAKANGHDVREKGRIPAAVLEAYAAAHE